MSKGLVALQNLRTFYTVVSKDLKEHYIFASDTKEYQIIENELKGKDNLVSMCENLAKLVGLEEKDYVELETRITKKLKAFDIIIAKCVHPLTFAMSSNCEDYNKIVCDSKKLTDEEYDLLREVTL